MQRCHTDFDHMPVVRKGDTVTAVTQEFEAGQKVGAYDAHTHTHTNMHIHAHTQYAHSYPSRTFTYICIYIHLCFYMCILDMSSDGVEHKLLGVEEHTCDALHCRVGEELVITTVRDNMTPFYMYVCVCACACACVCVCVRARVCVCETNTHSPNILQR